jgi:hypothetical protein
MSRHDGLCRIQPNDVGCQQQPHAFSQTCPSPIFLSPTTTAQAQLRLFQLQSYFSNNTQTFPNVNASNNEWLEGVGAGEAGAGLCGTSDMSTLLNWQDGAQQVSMDIYMRIEDHIEDYMGVKISRSLAIPNKPEKQHWISLLATTYIDHTH